VSRLMSERLQRRPTPANAAVDRQPRGDESIGDVVGRSAMALEVAESRHQLPTGK
jgi:hypothetical protein